MPGFTDPKMEAVFYAATGDMTRQFLTKGQLKSFQKSLVVAGADAAYQYTFADTLEILLTGLAGNNVGAEVTSALSEIIGTAGYLWLMDSVGIISKKNAEVDGATGGTPKDAGFMNALMLATQDILVGRGLKLTYDAVWPQASGSSASQ